MDPGDQECVFCISLLGYPWTSTIEVPVILVVDLGGGVLLTLLTDCRHVPNKVALVDLMLDAATGPPPAAANAPGMWRDRLAGWARAGLERQQPRVRRSTLKWVQDWDYNSSLVPLLVGRSGWRRSSCTPRCGPASGMTVALPPLGGTSERPWRLPGPGVFERRRRRGRPADRDAAVGSDDGALQQFAVRLRRTYTAA